MNRCRNAEMSEVVRQLLFADGTAGLSPLLFSAGLHLRRVKHVTDLSGSC